MRHIVTLLLALLVAACASTPQASRERDAEAKLFGSSPAAATVYIYRPAATPAPQDETVLWIDNQLIGATLPLAYFRVHLEPGRHVFTGLAYDTGRLELEVRPGEVYFVEQAITSGQSRFRVVSADLGKKVITKCCHLLETWAPGQRPLLR
jgi:Protein of unknown function (DUF2846)